MKEESRSEVEWWMRFHHLRKERRPHAVRRNRLSQAILTGACPRPERSNPSHGAAGQRQSNGGRVLQIAGRAVRGGPGSRLELMYDWLTTLDNVREVELAHLRGAGDRRGAGQDRLHRCAHLGAIAART